MNKIKALNTQKLQNPNAMHALKHYKYKYYSTMCSFCLLYDLNYVVGNNLFLFFFSSFSVVYCQLNMISHEKVFLFATKLKMDRPHLLLNFNILTLFINFLDCIMFLTSHISTLPIYIYTQYRYVYVIRYKITLNSKLRLKLSSRGFRIKID